MDRNSLLNEFPHIKNPNKYKLIEKWIKKYKKYQDDVEYQVDLYSLHNLLKIYDNEFDENDENEEIDLTKLIPSDPCQCEELYKLNGNNNKYKKSVINKNHCCKKCINSNRKIPGGKYCMKHSSNQFTEDHVLGDNNYFQNLKINYIDKAPPFTEFIKRRDENKLIDGKTRILIDRTNNTLHRPQTNRYLSFYHDIENSRRLITSESYPSELNIKNLTWKCQKSFIVLSELKDYKEKTKLNEPIIKVNNKSYNTLPLRDFKNVNYVYNENNEN